jgi:hypothetical protein
VARPLAAALLVVCLAAPSASAQEGNPWLVAFEAKEVLRSRCLACHDNASKERVPVLDRARLVNDPRAFIRPRNPDGSELLRLVVEGSEPPGAWPKVPQKESLILRKWVEANAPEFPPDFGDAYIFYHLLRDLKARDKPERALTRYLSLNHLLANAQGVTELDQKRKELQDTIGEFSKEPKGDLLVPIDSPRNTIFRIDLRRLGWDSHPYQKESAINLFDLLLLEYPNGSVPGEAENGKARHGELIRFLRNEAQQVRPIPYIEADWLLSAGGLANPVLKADFLTMLGKKPLARGLATSLADVRRTEQREAGRAGQVLQRRSIPILPLDGLTAGDFEKESFQIDFRLVKFEDRRLAKPTAQHDFEAGDNAAIWVNASEDAIVQIVDTDEDGHKDLMENLDRKSIKKGPYALSGNIPLPMNAADPAKPRSMLTLYAFPAAYLDRLTEPFPEGKVLKQEGITDRILHPSLYRLDEEGKVLPPDPAKMIKITFSYKVHPRKARKP